jgi:poly-gamma-glutamate synthesis protein (capsule biosynthesis protein)
MGRNTAATAGGSGRSSRSRRLPPSAVLVGVLGGAVLLTVGLATAGPPPYHQAIRGAGRPAPAAAAVAAPATTSTAPLAPTSPLATTPTNVTMAFAGDVHFAGRVARRATAGSDVLGPIGRTLAAADIAMVNLESAITERGTPEPKEFHFRAPPAALDSLRAAGVDVVTMANNHAVDYGLVGLADSLAAIGAHHEPVIGIGRDAAAAYSPWFTEVRGVRVAVLAASQIHDRTQRAWTAGPTSPGIASAGSARLVSAVRDARARAQIVVVYLHWGTEGQACPNGEQRAIARRLSAAGADAVVGTHAHLLLGAGWLGPTYVDYGLGNFLWWRDNAYSNDTGVLTLTFHGRRVVRGQLTPAEIDGAGVPRPARGESARRVLGTLSQVSRCAGLAGRPG